VVDDDLDEWPTNQHELDKSQPSLAMAQEKKQMRVGGILQLVIILDLYLYWISS